MKKCDKFVCVANLNGECVNDECRGELIQRPPCRISDKEKRKEWYNFHADTFRRDFPETYIKAQMRQDGICEDDIELAVSAIDELKKGGGRMAEYIERDKVYNMLNALGGCGADPDTWADGWDKAIDTAIEELDDIPAADVRPERHGEWNELSLDDQDEGMYICSKCKSIEFMPEECDIYAYCPNCGAKMDGKDGDSG